MRLIKLNNFKLKNLPCGLFLFEDTLCVKTEYRTEQGAIESYIVSSGEFFWGGQSFQNQPEIIVTQVQVDKSNDNNEQIDGIPYVPFPIAFHTVDIIATNMNNNKILLGRKHNSNEWVFIGGFVEPTHTAEHTAAKEFHEEANVLIDDESRFKYLGSLFIDDARYKNSCHKITSSIFTIWLSGNEYDMVKGGDDIAEVKWFDMEDVESNLKEQHKKVFIKYLLSIQRH